MEPEERKRLIAKIIALPSDEERIYHGVWYLLFFARQEIIRDSEYRIYSILTAMDVIPWPNKEVLRYKGIISNAYKKALTEYNKEIGDSEERIKIRKFFYDTAYSL